MTTAKHTDLSIHRLVEHSTIVDVGQDGQIFCSVFGVDHVEAKARAERVIAACNSHTALYEACKALVERFTNEAGKCTHCGQIGTHQSWCCLRSMAAALAKADGGGE